MSGELTLEEYTAAKRVLRQLHLVPGDNRCPLCLQPMMEETDLDCPVDYVCPKHGSWIVAFGVLEEQPPGCNSYFTFARPELL